MHSFRYHWSLGFSPIIKNKLFLGTSKLKFSRFVEKGLQSYAELFFSSKFKVFKSETVEARKYLKIKIQVIIFCYGFLAIYHFLTYITKIQPPAPKKKIIIPTNQPNKQTKKQCLTKVENYKIFNLISEKGTLYLLFSSQIVNILNGIIELNKITTLNFSQTVTLRS